jgi:UDP:flavonoid glycosyltransferase YjiC (YdhE family)
MSQLAELIRGARLVISNGGDTLLQAIACARPCIAVPIAGDQAHRIEQCERAGLALSARLDANDIARTALAFLKDEAHQAALTAKLSTAAVQNGMEPALRAIERLSAPRR